MTEVGVGIDLDTMVYIYGARAGNPEKARENPAFPSFSQAAAQFSSAVSPVLFCCSSPSSSVLPSLSSCSVVRRRPVQFGRLSRLVLLFVAVQFGSAVSRLVRLSDEYSGKSELEQQKENHDIINLYI